jgi:hypothetical protein
MIFSETFGKKTQFTSPVYVYKSHFLVSSIMNFLFQIDFLYPQMSENKKNIVRISQISENKSRQPTRRGLETIVSRNLTI